MRKLLLLFSGVATLAANLSAHADVPHPSVPAPAVGSGGILQIAFSLVLVLVVIVLVAWLLKRMNITQPGKGNHLKILGGIAVGQRERVVLVEIEDIWLVVGVGPGQIRTLHTLPKSTSTNDSAPAATDTTPFNVWLKKIIEKRDAT